MLKKIITVTLLAAVTVALAACASSGPSSLSGKKPVLDQKGHIIGYQDK